MGQGRRRQQRKQWLANEQEYRRQLGVGAGEALPNVIGEAHSAGAAKGGKPGARPAHRTRFGGKGRVQPVPEIKLTAKQVRTVKCPRCLAAVDAPCRDQYGRAVSAGHADRRRLAQQRIGDQQRARAAQAAPVAAAVLTLEELNERRAIARKGRFARQPKVEGDRAVYSVDAATSRVRPHRLRVDNG